MSTEIRLSWPADSDTAPLSPPPPWEPQFEHLPPSTPRPRRPLDPPPPCFSTPSPPRIRPHDFPPFYIPPASDTLADGFRLLYPRDVFERHGVSRADWVRFLEDLGIAARLSHEGLSAVRSRPPVAPSLAVLFPARTLGAVYDARFASRPAEEVRALIQIWNQCAFERRRIRVTLQVRRPVGTRGRRSHALVVASL